MPRLVSFLLFGLAVFLSCAPKTEQPSIPDDKMAAIMADLFVAESATVGLGGYPKDSLQQAYYQQVLKIHGITLEEYERNLRIYADDVPRMEELVKKAEGIVNPSDTTGKK
jgi:hypothetical protein